MGEVQGNLWTTLVFATLFLGMLTMLFWVMDIMEYHSTVLTVEDNIRAGNLEIFNNLSDDYSPCVGAYTTATDCSGVIEVNKAKHYVKYQLSYDGGMMNVDASGDTDTIVLLPY